MIPVSALTRDQKPLVINWLNSITADNRLIWADGIDLIHSIGLLSLSTRVIIETKLNQYRNIIDFEFSQTDYCFNVSGVELATLLPLLGPVHTTPALARAPSPAPGSPYLFAPSPPVGFPLPQPAVLNQNNWQQQTRKTLYDFTIQNEGKLKAYGLLQKMREIQDALLLRYNIENASQNIIKFYLEVSRESYEPKISDNKINFYTELLTILDKIIDAYQKLASVQRNHTNPAPLSPYLFGPSPQPSSVALPTRSMPRVNTGVSSWQQNAKMRLDEFMFNNADLIAMYALMTNMQKVQNSLQSSKIEKLTAAIEDFQQRISEPSASPLPPEKDAFYQQLKRVLEEIINSYDR